MILSKKNKLLLVSVFGTLALSAGVTGAVATTDAKAAEVDTTTYSLAMDAGASVRTDDQRAIRFTSSIEVGELNALVEAGKDVRIRTMITATDYLDEGEAFTAETEWEENEQVKTVEFSKANENLTAIRANYDETEKVWKSSETGTHYVYYACLYDLQDKNLTREFSARTYMQVDNQIVAYTEYSETDNSRCIWDVAKSTLDAGEYTDDPNDTKDEYDNLSLLCAEYNVALTGFDEVYNLPVKRGQTLVAYEEMIKAELDVEGAAYYLGTVTDAEGAAYDMESLILENTSLTADMDSLTFTLQGDSAYVLSGRKVLNQAETELKALKVPATYGGLPVVSVASQAFNDKAGDITSIVLPSSVTSIGEKAFRLCSNLTQVVAPGITGTLYGRFYGCDNLTALVVGKGTTLPDSNDYQPKNASNAGKLSVYVADGTLSDIAISGFTKSTMFSKKVYAYSETEIAGGFKFDENGLAVAYDEGSYYNYTDQLLYCTSAYAFNFTPNDANCTLNGFNEEKIPSDVAIAAIVPETWSDGENTYTVTAVAGGQYSSTGGAFNADYNTSIATILKSNLRKVVLPKTVTSIGSHAFRKCVAMTYFAAPGVKNTELVATHYGCDGLDTVVLGNNVTLGKDWTNQGAPITYFAVYIALEESETASLKVKDSVNSEPGKVGALFTGKVYLYSETEIAGGFKFDENGYAVAYSAESHYMYDVETDTLTVPTAEA